MAILGTALKEVKASDAATTMKGDDVSQPTEAEADTAGAADVSTDST